MRSCSLESSYTIELLVFRFSIVIDVFTSSQSEQLWCTPLLLLYVYLNKLILEVQSLWRALGRLAST